MMLELNKKNFNSDIKEIITNYVKNNTMNEKEL